ncbi:hypothetical protein OV203_25325 [Nannocystis sp. ILAH1]|uniref:hypothetical protein n=1 Tax=Nannocystis sp. ILAH1 TaxID=2996789 RepID=UPI00226F3734|nr:hypothetical protein [Nannocystis sp. ILAH1]MCY0990488.1 hypothetical protein [Nannocystis sp. ILAH1]
MTASQVRLLSCVTLAVSIVAPACSIYKDLLTATDASTGDNPGASETAGGTEGMSSSGEWTSSGPGSGVTDGITTGVGTTEEASGTSNTGSASASEPGEGSATTGCEFVCPPDMGPEIPQCDPMAQDCPAGQKCVWYATPGEMRRRDHARCVDVVGDGAPFAACSLPNGIWLDVSDDCGPESFCLEAFGVTDHGFCAPYPKPGSQDCSDFPGTQYATENGSIFPHACLHFECNPQAPETCPADLQCLFYPAFLYGTNFCWEVPRGELPLGADCDYDQCGQGKLCLPAEHVPGCAEERCCSEWCDLAAPDCSDPAASCDDFPVWMEEDPSFATLGACVVPGSLEP